MMFWIINQIIETEVDEKWYSCFVTENNLEPGIWRLTKLLMFVVFAAVNETIKVLSLTIIRSSLLLLLLYKHIEKHVKTIIKIDKY